jgi:hypothetical protein
MRALLAGFDYLNEGGHMQLIAVLRVKPGATEQQQVPLRKPEASKVWELMVADVVRSIHFIPGPGALLHLEAKDDAEAQAYINHLPMVRAGVVSIELLPLRPFTGLEALFGKVQ